MKVLIFSQYWAPENGVPQRRWAWLTEALVNHGHSVLVVAPPPHYKRNVSIREWWKQKSFSPSTKSERGEFGETIIRTGFIPAGISLTQRILNQGVVAAASLLASRRIRRVASGYKPDLIIGTVPAIPTAFVTAVSAKRFAVPYVIDLRDAWPDLLEESLHWNRSLGTPSLREKMFSRGPLQVMVWLTERLLNRILSQSAGIIVTSKYLKEDLEVRESIARSDGRPLVRLVRNVFPPETSTRKLPSRHRGKMRKLNVLYAGTLGRAQNLANAIEALGIANRQGYQVNLRFVGAGAAKRALQNLADELELNIEFFPQASAAALDPHYDWADTALVHLTDWPSLRRAIPSKMYELMSLGIHISGVVEGESASLIKQLDAGHVIQPEDPRALAQLWMQLIDDPRRLSIGLKGRDWVSEQRCAEAPQEFKKLLSEVVGDLK